MSEYRDGVPAPSLAKSSLGSVSTPTVSDGRPAADALTRHAAIDAPPCCLC